MKNLTSAEGHPPSVPERILIIDDDPDLRNLLIKRFTKSGLSVDEAENIETAKRKLYEYPYDLILLDLVMYPDSGYILFDFLKNDPKLKWIPLIVLSGSDDVDDKVQCLVLGADDYVTKPFDFKELRARVLRLLRRAREFEQMAFRDALTGVYNRRYFDSQMEIELQRIKRLPAYMTIALIDIDRFKTINDTFGHPVGDIVLQGVSYIIKDNIRQTDLLARYGGEEFIVLLFDTSEKEAREILERALTKVRDKEFVRVHDQAVQATFSAGIAGWDPQLSKHDWVERADQLLYQAKQAGRNQVMAWCQHEQIAQKVNTKQVLPWVLIADSDTLMHEIVSSSLRNLGVEAIHAYNLEEAERILMEKSVSICVIGENMLTRSTMNSPLVDVKKIVISELGKRTTSAERDWGIFDYIEKPFSLLDFESRFRSLLTLNPKWVQG